jgi:hypothetical protein
MGFLPAPDEARSMHEKINLLVQVVNSQSAFGAVPCRN